MKRSFVAAALVALLHLQAAPAAACGIKLVIKTSTPRKTVARSANPSRMLLLGSPPHRLERELSEAGHDVEVESDINSAKRPTYAVVVTDSAHADAARAKFTGAVVVVRSGDVSSDIASIEAQIARKPVRTEEARTVVAARPSRTPVAAGPTADTHTLVTAKPATAEPPADATVDKPAEPPPAATPKPPPAPPPKPTPAIAATPKPPPPETRPAKPAAPAAFHEEFYFGLGSYSVGAMNASLARAVRWLNASPDVHVAVEGYADPSGNHDANMALSERRAEAVRDALVGLGIDASRLEVVSYGDTKLKYGAADGRNRRVALSVKP